PDRDAAAAGAAPRGAHRPRAGGGGAAARRAGGAMSVAVEIAVEDLAGLEVAALAGADRVELCTDLDRGGLTPPAALVAACPARGVRVLGRGGLADGAAGRGERRRGGGRRGARCPHRRR